MQLDLLYSLLVPILTLYSVLTATWLPLGPRIGITSSLTSLLLEGHDIFAVFRDDSPELYDIYEKYDRNSHSPLPAIASVASSAIMYKASAPSRNTTCLPRALDPTSGLFMSVGTTPYYESPRDGNGPRIRHLYNSGRMGLVGLMAAVVGIVYYLHPVHADSNSRETANSAVLEDLEKAVCSSELRFAERVTVLDKYPSILAQIGDAITASSEAQAELDVRVAHEYDRTLRHEEHVVSLLEYNDRLEGEYDSLQRRIIESCEATSRVEAKSTEEYVKLLAELEEAEALRESAERMLAEQTAVVHTTERELTAARTARDACSFEHDVLRKQIEYLESLDLTKEKEHEEEVASLEASRADVESTLSHTVKRVEVALSHADGLQRAVDLVVSAAHHAEEALQGNIDTAAATVMSLEVDQTTQAARHSDVLAAHNILETIYQTALKEEEELNTEATRLDTEVHDLRSQAMKEDEAHAERALSLSEDHEALAVSHAAILEELALAKGNLYRADEDAQLSLAAVCAARAFAEGEHNAAILSLHQSIASNDARFAELQASELSLKQELAAKQAEFNARWSLFVKMDLEHNIRLEACMTGTKEANAEAQKYESLYNEAHNGRRSAERQAVTAQKRAAAAEELSLNTRKEMVISENAFATQLEDIEEQNESLQGSNKALIAAIASLRADKTMITEVISNLEKTFEDRERPLQIRLRRAEQDLDLCSMEEADAVCQLDAVLTRLHDEQNQVVTQHAAYRESLVDLDAELERVTALQLDMAAATRAADGQAKALERILLTPGPDTVDSAMFSSTSEASPSSTASTATLPDDGFDMLFDASFEEAQSGDIADSTTVCGLGELGSGSTQNKVGLGLVM